MDVVTSIVLLLLHKPLNRIGRQGILCNVLFYERDGVGASGNIHLVGANCNTVRTCPTIFVFLCYLQN